MKYKVGDKVKIVSLQSEGRGLCQDVVGDIGDIVLYDPSDILKYKVKIEDGGGRWWWEESNLELIEDVKPNTIKEETEMNATKVENTTPKFKKGDKVTLVGNYELGVFEVLAYSSGGYCCYQKGFQGHSGNSSLGMETFVGTEYEAQCCWFLESHLEIVEVSKNYREMNPNDLITIGVDGVESEVPLGDIVHAVTILGVTNGYHGSHIWRALRKPFDRESFVQDGGTVVEFRDKEKEALDYFFQSYYDKQQQEKDELKTLIEDKMEEVDALVKPVKPVKSDVENTNAYIQQR